MSKSSLHPNTSAMLQAWKRITSAPEDIEGGPSADEFPGLLGRLFVIEYRESGFVPFRIAGEELNTILGRNLVGTDFLNLWVGPDRALAAALLQCIISEDEPGLLRGFGETSRRRRVEVELAIAPLTDHHAGGARLLCLYQTLGGEAMLHRQTVWTHRIRSVYPPEPPARPANLRLVSSK